MRRRIILACIGTALFMLVLIPVRAAIAEECYYCNPLFYPFAVAGTVVGGAVTIATAPFAPLCHRVWIPGHFTVRGYWIPGHWRYYR